MRKSTIIKDIQDMLANALPNVKYIDKDWGQLELERPAVGFPCILLDIDQVEYSDLGAGWQMAEGIVTVKIANQRTNASSAHAPETAKGQSYLTLELCDTVHELLHGFNGNHGPSQYAPLTCTSFYKLEDGLRMDTYVTRYTTQWKVPPAEKATTHPQTVGIGVEFDPHPGQQ